MMASCSVAVRPLPELIEKVRRGELEVPPKNIRRVYGARLDRVVRPFLDVEIPESLARTPLGASVISERTELISAYENAIEKYVRLGTPATLMILAPGGWQIHIDLAVSTETVGAVETGTLACSRYLVIGTAVRATAEMAEQNMAQRGLLGGPETFFQFAPLPPPLPPRPPAFDTELEFATPVDEKGYALPVAAAASAVALPVVPPPGCHTGARPGQFSRGPHCPLESHCRRDRAGRRDGAGTPNSGDRGGSVCAPPAGGAHSALARTGRLAQRARGRISGTPATGRPRGAPVPARVGAWLAGKASAAKWRSRRN